MDHVTDTVREVALAGGSRLAVREVRPDDVGALIDLYDALDDDDRYRRFFSIVRRPSSHFFADLSSVGDRGGARLVAEVIDEAGPHIVAEAGYELLANGNGELAITVARGWRGWLGHYLLHALRELAAARSVPNLEADALSINHPMLALLRAPGYASIRTGDPTIVRLVIGTEGRTPRWAPHDRRPRLLEEGGTWWTPDGPAGGAGTQQLRCPGPRGLRRGCPAMDGLPCPLAQGADLIVVHTEALGDGLSMAERHADLHPGVPVREARLPR
jgi:hypothetical protein